MSDIGQFVIGQSQIGTVPPFDYNTTIISQYANSPILYQLIQNFNSNLDQTQNLDAFYDDIWNIQTASGYGLDLIGRIVGVNRYLPVVAGEYFGYEEAGNLNAGRFGTAPFYGGQTLTNNFALADSSFQTLIYAKMLSNITDCAIPSLNKLLATIFPGRGDCHVTDGRNMTMGYVFNFPTTAVEQSIVTNLGVFPRPSGVSVSYSFI